MFFFWFELTVWPHEDQGLQIAISMVFRVLWFQITAWAHKDQGLQMV